MQTAENAMLNFCGALGSVPSAAEAAFSGGVLTAGLKPRPFKAKTRTEGLPL